MPRHLRLPPFTPSRRYLRPIRASPQIRFEGDWTQAELRLLQNAIADAEGRESSLRVRPEITSCRMDTRIARLCCGRARLEERAYRWAIAERVAGCYCVRRHVSRSSNTPTLFVRWLILHSAADLRPRRHPYHHLVERHYRCHFRCLRRRPRRSASTIS